MAEMVRSFRCNDDEDTEVPHHLENTDVFEKQFCEDVKSLRDVIIELGNPFTDTEGELLDIINKTIMSLLCLRNLLIPLKMPFPSEKTSTATTSRHESLNAKFLFTKKFKRIISPCSVKKTNFHI